MNEHKCIQEQRISDLETGMEETRVYIKMIKEDITDIKQSVKEIKALLEPQNDVNIKAWQPIMIELIKLTDISVKILAAIVGAVKLLGK